MFPGKKPDDLVHGLRAVNDVVTDFLACVPDPHALLAQLPPEVMHMCHEDSTKLLQIVAQEAHMLSQE